MVLRSAPLYRLTHYTVYLYSTCALSLFFCVADQALGHAGLLPTNATILCAVLIAPFVVRASIPEPTGGTLGTPLIRSLWANRFVVLGFMAIALVALMLSILPTAYWGENGKWIAVVPYDVTISVSSLALGLSAVVTRHLPSTIVVSLVALACSIWYDMLHPGTFAEMTNRAAGFPGNANFAALTAVLLCAAGLNFGERVESAQRRTSLVLDMLILLITGIVVTMTMSRSGLLNFTSVVSLFLFSRFFRSRTSWRQRLKELTAVTCVAGVTLVCIVWVYSLSASENQSNRLTRFLNNQQIDDGSAGTRLAAVQDSIRLIEEAPIFGHGTGFARTMNELPHNMYLQQWVNNGIPGIGAYILFLVSAFVTFTRRGCRNGQALVLAAGLGGIFSHNVIDSRPFLMLMGILLSSSHRAQQQRDIPVQLVLLRSDSTRFAAPQRASGVLVTAL